MAATATPPRAAVTTMAATERGEESSSSRRRLPSSHQSAGTPRPASAPVSPAATAISTMAPWTLAICPSGWLASRAYLWTSSSYDVDDVLPREMSAPRLPPLG
jgi:hypothetical protein